MPSIRLPSASWPVHHGRIMWITQKVFLLLLFRIEHGGVSKGLALQLIQPDRVQSDDVVYTKIFSRFVALNVIVPYVVDVFPGYRQNGGSCSIMASAWRINAKRLPPSTSRSIRAVRAWNSSLSQNE